MIVWHTQRPRPRLRFPWTWIGDFGLGLGPGTWNLELGLVRANGQQCLVRPTCGQTKVWHWLLSHVGVRWMAIHHI